MEAVSKHQIGLKARPLEKALAKDRRARLDVVGRPATRSSSMTPGYGHRVVVKARIAALGVLLVLTGCSSFPARDPVFESTEVTDSMRRGGDCDGYCVIVTAMVRGSREGEGSCALYGPGDPETLEPLVESDSIEMIPDQESEWVVELAEGAPTTSELNPVCKPMAEG